MVNFEYYTPTKVVFGKDTEKEVGQLVKAYGGTKVLVHFGGGSVKRSGLLDRVLASLDEAGIAHVELGGVVPNPRLSKVREGIELGKAEGIDFLLAVGGGSVIDSAKAIGYGMCYDGDVWDFFSGAAVPKASMKLGSDMSVPNGIAVTADHKIVYHTDTYTQTIFAYDYDETTGELTNKRPVVTIPAEEGNPDGFNIAADGTLFICHWSGHAVHRYDPATGKKIASYEVPAVHATCCCFGGKDLDELYVTTSSIDAPEEEYPLAGSIFMFKPGVKGVKVDRYKL